MYEPKQRFQWNRLRNCVYRSELLQLVGNMRIYRLMTMSLDNLNHSRINTNCYIIVIYIVVSRTPGQWPWLFEFAGSAIQAVPNSNII